MIGFYNYTVWLTFIGMLSSVVGMGFAVQGKIIAAVICLMFSGFCDMFDGIVARTKKDRTDEEKRFGIQLDSLSDIVCFGVLPFVIGVSVGAREWWQIAIMALFALAGLIRLAYYNVTEETRQQQTDRRKAQALSRRSDNLIGADGSAAFLLQRIACRRVSDSVYAASAGQRRAVCRACPGQKAQQDRPCHYARYRHRLHGADTHLQINLICMTKSRVHPNAAFRCVFII